MTSQDNEYLFEHINGNAQFVQNTTFGLREKTIAQLRKMFRKYQLTHMRVSPLC